MNNKNINYISEDFDSFDSLKTHFNSDYEDSEDSENYNTFICDICNNEKYEIENEFINICDECIIFIFNIKILFI